MREYTIGDTKNWKKRVARKIRKQKQKLDKIKNQDPKERYMPARKAASAR